jgi:hypothetical protein
MDAFCYRFDLSLKVIPFQMVIKGTGHDTKAIGDIEPQAREFTQVGCLSSALLKHVFVDLLKFSYKHNAFPPSQEKKDVRSFLSKIRFSPQSRQDRREKVVFDLVVRGHQIKRPHPFRYVFGRRHGASGESASHRFSRNILPSQRPLRLGGEPGFEIGAYRSKNPMKSTQ